MENETAEQAILRMQAKDDALKKWEWAKEMDRLRNQQKHDIDWQKLMTQKWPPDDEDNKKVKPPLGVGQEPPTPPVPTNSLWSTTETSNQQISLREKDGKYYLVWSRLSGQSFTIEIDRERMSDLHALLFSILMGPK